MLEIENKDKQNVCTVKKMDWNIQTKKTKTTKNKNKTLVLSFRSILLCCDFQLHLKWTNYAVKHHTCWFLVLMLTDITTHCVVVLSSKSLPQNSWNIWLSTRSGFKEVILSVWDILIFTACCSHILILMSDPWTSQSPPTPAAASHSMALQVNLIYLFIDRVCSTVVFEVAFV